MMTNKQRNGFIATVLAVLWSFAGIRKGRDYQLDAEQLNPKHVIIAGIIGGILFVFTILAVVNIVVSQ
ncbi:MAG: DUF2970 domain-containing protein [Moraxellaceae bacterium]|nr:DUF2970 domain-containing protein [Moraxellaceae bacterium]